ncbi:type II toxin-antitoxin system PemK/MazF family toxin [bacterium]|nr:type II toxin-antitoxin system PemK/MazF family toxin [bacterium]
MTIFDQGQVVLVPFPFTDVKMDKKRPAVVVSKRWFNKEKRLCILSAITSSYDKELEKDEIRIMGQDKDCSGLKFDSIIKTGKMFAIDQNRILKCLGSLPKKKHNELRKVLSEIFDLSLSTI